MNERLADKVLVSSVEEEIPWKRQESWFTVFKVALMAISKKRLETGEQVPLPGERCSRL